MRAFLATTADRRVGRLADQGWLSGRVAVHQIIVVLEHSTRRLGAMLSDVEALDGQIASLSLHPTEAGACELVLRARFPAPKDAEELVRRFSAYQNVCSARIEHVLIR